MFAGCIFDRSDTIFKVMRSVLRTDSDDMTK